MNIHFDKSSLVFNQGFIEIIKSPGKKNISCQDSHTEDIKSYGYKDAFYIETTRNDTDFSININGMAACSVEVIKGYICAKAVAIDKSALLAKFGAIQLRIKKEAIGRLHLKVNTGVIIDNSNLITVHPYGLTGFEGLFKGDLANQDTLIQVKAGAIVCTIC